ncbi:MAG TPA: amidohydrolase family protein [Actinomycetes bacterium]|nr:amidohydrolase family protein [Actinomycetes bacterium]
MEAWTAGRVFDGEQVLPAGSAVVVDGGQVVAVLGPGERAPDAAVPVDHPDATLLPGLVETHAHLCCDGGPGALERIPDASDEEMWSVIETSLRAQLAAGVTTVRDLGDRRYSAVEWRDAHAGDASFPRVLASGPPITTPGGHCANMGGETAGAGALRAAVRARAERGVDVVKIMASGGVNTAGSDAAAPQFGVGDLRVVVEEAHRLGLPVTAHAHSVGSVGDAIDAGVDAVEHATFVTGTGFAPDPTAVAQLAARRLPVCPTLGIVPGVTPPPAVLEMMRRTGMTTESRAAMFADLHHAGVLLVSGSDAGINPGKRHGVLPEALVQLAQAGVPVVDVLASGTSRAADALAVGDRTGRLRAGLDADLLVVRGDPIVDVTRLRDVLAVVARGRRVA